MPPDTAEYLPDEESLIRAALGSARPVTAAAEGTLPPVSVSVVHGNLSFVEEPVAVGHYRGDNLVSAEAVLDRRLNGRLRKRYDLGLYPGLKGTHEIVLDHTAGGQLTGAIIIGLGEVGLLTPGILSASVRAAIMRYALKVTEEHSISQKHIKLASLLIGSGSGGLTVDNVLNAILKGAVQANEELTGDTKNTDRMICSVEFIELYEDRAALAQHHLNQIEKNAPYRGRIKVASHVKQMEGGQRRAYELEQDDWWPRVRIETRSDGSLNFTVIAQGARVPMEITATQRRSVEPFLKAATSSVLSTDKVGRVLFELLVPAEFKHHAPENRNLVLVVDQETAKYPWELMEYPAPDGDKALAGEASLIRQLAIPGAGNTMSTNRGEVVIIADPDLKLSDYPQLPGAESEGKTVADLFKKDSRWKKPKEMIDPKPTGVDIIRELMTRDKIQILHIAAHGVVNYEVESQSKNESSLKLTGVLIGKDHVLTAAEIKQMPSTPQLVFINACYLGKTDGGKFSKLDQPNLLAADFGISLIKKGIPAVVVAGWEVHDAAAELFAKTFYSQMLNKLTFGHAVKAARVQTQKAYPQFNTWGAYQCYGDPAFQLVDASISTASDKGEDKQFVSLNHYLIAIENIAERAKTTSNSAELVTKLNKIVKGLPSKWQDDARLQACLGKAWGELRQFKPSIKAYQAAAQAERPTTTITDLEQLANLKARYAKELEEAGDSRAAKAYIQDAIKSLKLLNEQHGYSIERLNILGSTYKRRAILFGPETRSRENSLTEACSFYRQANQLNMQLTGGRPLAYSVINLLTLWYLLRYYTTEGCKLDQQQVDQWISKLKEDQPDIELSRESFWIDVTGADLQVLESLLNDSLNDMAAHIATSYINIRQQASSPRQFGSVVEHLQIVHQLAKQAPVSKLKDKAKLQHSQKNLVSGLQQIIDGLSL